MNCLKCKGTSIDFCHEPKISEQQLDTLRNMIKCLCKCGDTDAEEVTLEPENQVADITISGAAKVGETLTAEVTDLNGLPSNINYQ